MTKTTTQLIIETVIGAIVGSVVAYLIFSNAIIGDIKVKEAQKKEIERIIEEKLNNKVPR